MKINKYKIEVAMARNGYDPQDLAKASGLSASCVYDLMHRKKCRPSTAGKLAKALGVDVTEITEDESHEATA